MIAFNGDAKLLICHKVKTEFDLSWSVFPDCLDCVSPEDEVNWNYTCQDFEVVFWFWQILWLGRLSEAWKGKDSNMCF